jgi:hypothetical protein
MARLQEGIHFSATINNICFYEMYGQTYIRTKSSLSRQRVLKSKEFAKTRQYAGNFAIAAKLASPIYKALPEDIRARWIYRTIAGEAASLLYQGKTEQEVNDILWKKYIHDTTTENKNSQKTDTKVSSGTGKSNKSLKAAFSSRWELQGKPTYLFKNAWQEPRYYNPESVKRINDPFGLYQKLRN